MENLFYGPVFAKVTNNSDPEKMGRVKVAFDLLGDAMETDWIDVMNSYKGSFFMPELNDQVVVAFMGGSLSAGVVLGGIWSPNKKPPESGMGKAMDFNEDGQNLMRYFRTKGSNRMIFSDKPGQSTIQLINSMGVNQLELLAKNKAIKVNSRNKVIIKAAENLIVKANKGIIKAAKKIKIAGKPVTIKSLKNILCKAGQAITLKGKTVKLNCR